MWSILKEKAFFIICNMSRISSSTNSRPYIVDLNNWAPMTFREALDLIDKICKYSENSGAYSVYSPKYDNPHFIEK